MDSRIPLEFHWDSPDVVAAMLKLASGTLLETEPGAADEESTMMRLRQWKC